MDIITNIVIFLVVLLITFYYLMSSKNKSNFFVLLFSYLQGFILSFIYANLYNIPLTEVFITIPLFSATYYLLVKQIPYLIIALKSQRKKEEYNDEVLLSWLNTIEKLRGKQLKLSKYSGPRSFNAFFLGIPIPFSKKINIVIGQKLIDAFEAKQRIIIIAHEVGHYFNKHVLQRYLIFVVLTIIIEFIFLFFSNFIIFALNTSVEVKTLMFFVFGFFFFLLIIVIFNIISWYIEFNADKTSLELTKDIANFEIVFERIKNEVPTKNHGKLLNLILYDHPLTEDRLKKGKKYFLESIMTKSAESKEISKSRTMLIFSIFGSIIIFSLAGLLFLKSNFDINSYYGYLFFLSGLFLSFFNEVQSITKFLSEGRKNGISGLKVTSFTWFLFFSLTTMGSIVFLLGTFSNLIFYRICWTSQVNLGLLNNSYTWIIDTVFILFCSFSLFLSLLRISNPQGNFVLSPKRHIEIPFLFSLINKTSLAVFVGLFAVLQTSILLLLMYVLIVFPLFRFIIKYGSPN